MASEHAPVGVQLVHHDVAQVFEEPGPASVVRQHAGMQHVRVAEDDVGPPAYRPSRVAGRVSVVCEGPDVCSQSVPVAVELLELVHGQGLRGEQVERAGPGIDGERVEDRQVVAQRLAAGRRRDDNDVLAGSDSIPALGLMHVGPFDAALCEDA